MLSSLIWLVDLIEIFAQEYRLMSKIDFQSLHVAVLMNSTMCFNMLQIVENNSQLVTTCEWERVFPCFLLILLNCHKLSHGEIIQSKVFGSLKFSYVMMVKSLIAGLYTYKYTFTVIISFNNIIFIIIYINYIFRTPIPPGLVDLATFLGVVVGNTKSLYGATGEKRCRSEPKQSVKSVSEYRCRTSTQPFNGVFMRGHVHVLSKRF